MSKNFIIDAGVINVNKRRLKEYSGILSTCFIIASIFLGIPDRWGRPGHGN